MYQILPFTLTSPAVRAAAAERSNKILTNPTVEARIRLALVEFQLAEPSCKAAPTLAQKSVETVQTNTTI